MKLTVTVMFCSALLLSVFALSQAVDPACIDEEIHCSQLRCGRDNIPICLCDGKQYCNKCAYCEHHGNNIDTTMVKKLKGDCKPKTDNDGKQDCIGR